MSGSSRALAWSFACLFAFQACRVEADDVQEGVERYPSGDARVTVEWFAPAVRGKFPAILLLHGSGGLDPGTAQVFRAMGRDFAQQGYVALIPHYFERTDHTVGQPFEGKELQAFMGAVEDAIKFAAASGIVDEDRIGIIGYSMGCALRLLPGAQGPADQGDRLVFGQLAGPLQLEVPAGPHPPGVGRPRQPARGREEVPGGPERAGDTFGQSHLQEDGAQFRRRALGRRRRPRVGLLRQVSEEPQEREAQEIATRARRQGRGSRAHRPERCRRKGPRSRRRAWS